MSKGLGRIERAILGAIARDKVGLAGEPDPVRVTSWGILYDLFQPAYGAPSAGMGWGWTPRQATPAQRKTVVRALHSFVRKHPEYALTGGKGRKELILYEPADPVSAAWARLTVERRGFVPLCEVRASL